MIISSKVTVMVWPYKIMVTCIFCMLEGTNNPSYPSYSVFFLACWKTFRLEFQFIPRNAIFHKSFVSHSIDKNTSLLISEMWQLPGCFMFVTNLVQHSQQKKHCRQDSEEGRLIGDVTVATQIANFLCNQNEVFFFTMFYSWSISEWEYFLWSSEWSGSSSKHKFESDETPHATANTWCSWRCHWSCYKLKYWYGLLGWTNCNAYASAEGKGTCYPASWCSHSYWSCWTPWPFRTLGIDFYFFHFKNLQSHKLIFKLFGLI